ncbi:MAG: ATP-dependent DNA helicase UvrD2 [Actinobacteria bacterium]|nr:MAG: ATP-dependent DNA helicase UvrD2 [Actinomycetota bacterium]
MDAERILDDLNPEQRRAAEAVRGPVCILAGAGSGKTTTITRRIANQVATHTFAPTQILAVTFTDKAAGELRARLAALGAPGVTARTFHSAALAQLRHFAPDRIGRILASKALLLRQIGNTLPGAYRFRPAGDLATEVEWAKNRRLTLETYRAALAEAEHDPPIPPDLMARVFREYERRKAAADLVDFEDILALAIDLYDEDDWALGTFRERYRAFTVDEYQDVNLLQQTLLDRWLGASDELCAVGDDYQSIYSFTGATPEYLLALPRRFPHATVVRLEENYRSSPEVLELTNRLVPRLGGAEKVLRATRPSGPPPDLRGFSGPDEEAAFLAECVRALAEEGVPLEEMAVLFRTNARSADFEATLHAAGIPFQGASLLAREGARGLLKRLRGASGPAEKVVRRVAQELGWVPYPPEGLGEREQTRQSDLARIVAVAEGLDDVSELETELERLFGSGAARGVHLLTLHRAKGLEFDAVFLPRLEAGELPIRQAKSEAAVSEERRLLYVGMTRARRHLALTWAGRPSRFLAELGAETAPSREHRRLREEDLPPAGRALKAWRLERARADAVPAYVVFDDRTLEEIVRRAPASTSELAAVPGIGPARLERYGAEVLAVLSAA